MTDPILTSDPRARAAERATDDAYHAYQAVAGALSKLVTDNGDEEPGQGSAAYPEFVRLVKEKAKHEAAWRRAADRHHALVTGQEWR